MGCCLSKSSTTQANTEDDVSPPPPPAAAAADLVRAQSLLSVYSCEGQHVIEGPVVVGSFNIQNFGRKKVKDEDAVEAIVGIVRCHDLIAIQEVSDKSGQSIQQLLDRVNQDGGDGGYKLELSPRTGRTAAAAEQYAVLYKKDVFEMVSSVLYPDKNGTFTRQPFAIHLRTSKLSETFQDLVLITVHTAPKQAFEEIHGLDKVRQWAAKKFGLDDILIAGDFNASRPYIKDWQGNALRSKKYEWLIEDHEDTTVTKTMAAYDRIVAYGTALQEAVESASVLRYPDLDATISDHYPVRVTFKPKFHPAVRQWVDYRPSIFVRDLRKLAKSDLVATKEFPSSGDGELGGQFVSAQEALQALEPLRKANQLSYSLYASVKHAIYQVSSQDKLKRAPQGQVSVEFVLQRNGKLMAIVALK